MPVDYATLTLGQEISNQTYRLDADTVAAYVDAVGDRSGIFDVDADLSVAPPMSVAALSLRGLVHDLDVPQGTLHAGQELEFTGAVRVGDTLTCRATVLRNSVRGEWRHVVVGLAVEDGARRQVMRGKSTMVFPA